LALLLRRAGGGFDPENASAHQGNAVEDGWSLSAVRGRIKELKIQVEMLKGAPIP
jgi:hypothetical protein